MKAFLRQYWPFVLAGVLLVVLAVLTLLARRQHRDGWAQRARVSVLAALVALLAVPMAGGCTSSGKEGTTADAGRDDNPYRWEDEWISCYIAPWDGWTDPGPPDVGPDDFYDVPVEPDACDKYPKLCMDNAPGADPGTVAPDPNEGFVECYVPWLPDEGIGQPGLPETGGVDEVMADDEAGPVEDAE